MQKILGVAPEYHQAEARKEPQSSWPDDSAERKAPIQTATHSKQPRRRLALKPI